MEDTPTVHLTPARKLLATAMIMASTIVVVLDQTIANVALPHMQAALGATPDTISWVLTSYVLATAVATPMTGWLSGRFGRRNLFGFSIVGFTIASAACGFSVSLPMMVISRLVQGFCGAFLIPMSQAFMYDMNPPSQQVRAMTIWGLGVVAAPVLGPLVGGYLTEMFDWRWVFFINLPIGIVAAVGVFAALPHFPSIRRSFDHIGFILIVAGLCGLQLALDRGTQQDWFDSPEILIELGLSVSAFWLLIFHLRRAKHPLIPVSLFANRTFVMACIIGFTVSPIIIAGSALLPSLLQTLLGYPVFLAGVLFVPRGITLVFAMLLGARLLRLIDGRLIVFAGLMLLVISLYIQTRFSLQMGSDLMIWSGALQGAGMGLSLTTINYATVSSLSVALRTEGAAVFSLVRNIGSSVMIAASTGILAHNIQVNHAEVGSSIHNNNTALLMPRILGGDFAGDKVAAMMDAEVTRQAMMIAYINDFWLMMWAAVAVIPVVYLLGPIRTPKGEPMTVSE